MFSQTIFSDPSDKFMPSFSWQADRLWGDEGDGAEESRKRVASNAPAGGDPFTDQAAALAQHLIRIRFVRQFRQQRMGG